MTKKMKIISGGILVAAVVAGLAVLKTKDSQTSDEDTEMTETVAKPVGPAFNPDSAFAFTAKQCDFGPRVMNSEAHDRCGAWIVSKFKAYGCTVEEQKADLKGYDGTMLHSTNIIARFRPEAKRRVMLCAHWDARPWADNDPDSTNHRKPVMAANDGASGVAVMIEVARQLSLMERNRMALSVCPQTSALILSASMPRTGDCHSGRPIWMRSVTHGPWEPFISPPIFRQGSLLSSPCCSTWLVARELSSTVRACRCSMRPTWSTGCGMQPGRLDLAATSPTTWEVW